MTDIVVDFMDRLRQEWPSVSVIASHHVADQTNVMGVNIQRWIQRPEGCEVSLYVAYYPSKDAPMQAMLQWLNQFHRLIRTTDPVDVFTQWWGQTAQFSTDPLRVTCTVLIRYGQEVL
ncbi:MAG: hypothetical protein Q8Q56_05720 [Alphaproteobacteria bacterium]|nr:hypothetical protein [Alphaproteobacteria bacterium]